MIIYKSIDLNIIELCMYKYLKNYSPMYLEGKTMEKSS